MKRGSKDTALHPSHSLKRAGCHRACKIFGRDLTKMFHVKHFGKVLSRNRTIQGLEHRTQKWDTGFGKNPMLKQNVPPVFN